MSDHDLNPHFGAPNSWRPGALAPTCSPLATLLYRDR